MQTGRKNMKKQKVLRSPVVRFGNDKFQERLGSFDHPENVTVLPESTFSVPQSMDFDTSSELSKPPTILNRGEDPDDLDMPLKNFKEKTQKQGTGIIQRTLSTIAKPFTAKTEKRTLVKKLSNNGELIENTIDLPLSPSNKKSALFRRIFNRNKKPFDEELVFDSVAEQEDLLPHFRLPSDVPRYPTHSSPIYGDALGEWLRDDGTEPEKAPDLLEWGRDDETESTLRESLIDPDLALLNPTEKARVILQTPTPLPQEQAKGRNSQSTVASLQKSPGTPPQIPTRAKKIPGDVLTKSGTKIKKYRRKKGSRKNESPNSNYSPKRNSYMMNIEQKDNEDFKFIGIKESSPTNGINRDIGRSPDSVVDINHHEYLLPIAWQNEPRVSEISDADF